ncbi:MAG: hypothetical protein GY853_16545 [PVC group bacterium]|nr:hypothetical protein [PVC group bacterium]
MRKWKEYTAQEAVALITAMFMIMTNESKAFVEDMELGEVIRSIRMFLDEMERLDVLYEKFMKEDDWDNIFQLMIDEMGSGKNKDGDDWELIEE